MVKILIKKIGKCLECPLINYYIDTVICKHWLNKCKKIIEDPNLIPQWCPLADSKYVNISYIGKMTKISGGWPVVTKVVVETLTLVTKKENFLKRIIKYFLK